MTGSGQNLIKSSGTPTGSSFGIHKHKHLEISVEPHFAASWSQETQFNLRNQVCFPSKQANFLSHTCDIYNGRKMYFRSCKPVIFKKHLFGPLHWIITCLLSGVARLISYFVLLPSKLHGWGTKTSKHGSFEALKHI